MTRAYISPSQQPLQRRNPINYDNWLMGRNLLLQRRPVAYRGWLISTQVIEGRLWLRWQHPVEDFPRYSHEINGQGLSEAIRHVRFSIDIAIKLEESH